MSHEDLNIHCFDSKKKEKMQQNIQVYLAIYANCKTFFDLVSLFS